MSASGLSTGRIVLIIVAVFAAAFSGMYLGGIWKQESSKPIIMQQSADELQSGLTEGTLFPDVALLSETSDSVQSKSLYADSGRVVIFMELGCPPCKEISHRWEQLIEKGEVSVNWVCGITYSSPAEVRVYRAAEHYSFPIYSDTSLIFVSEHQVQNFPLVVYVGKSGQILGHTFDASAEIDLEGIRKLPVE